MYSTKVPPEFDRAQISTYFYSLSISNESDAILTKPKHAELQLHNFQQSIKGQPKLKVLLSKAMQEKANLKFIQGTGYTLYLSILVHHRFFRPVEVQQKVRPKASQLGVMDLVKT